MIGSLLENGFEATLSSATNVLRVWKKHFSIFCKFLSDEVETVFWESEANRSELFKSKFDHWKLLIKSFWSYLELKNECSARLKRAFFSFFANFWVTKLKLFSTKVRQSVENYLNQNLVIWSFYKTGFEAFWSSIPRLCTFEKGIFSFLQIFEWQRWNRFLGKQDNAAKTFFIKAT